MIWVIIIEVDLEVVESDNEIFLDLDEFYEVSNLGNIRSKRNNKILKTHNDSMSKGYKYITLNYKGVKKSYQIHRLVAKLFLPNPNNYPCINHKDENPSNNKVDNLEWCSYSYNLSYGTRIKKELATKSILNTKNSPKKVIQMDLQGNFIQEFESANSAAKFLNIANSHIINCCNNKICKDSKGKYYTCKSAGGFKFCWKSSTGIK